MRRRLVPLLLIAGVLAALLTACRVEVENPYEGEATTAIPDTSAPLTARPHSTTVSTGTSAGVTTALPQTEPPTTEPPTTQTPPITDPTPLPEPADEDMVAVADYLPEAILDIRYATTNNFTGQVIYKDTSPMLRYGTVKKLRLVCDLLAEEGYRLVIWDAWRPAAAQWKLWTICPDPTYVSDPNKGYSSHTRGGTVDVTMVRADGSALIMPTEFDDFSKAADLDFSDLPKEAADNATFLQTVMKTCGFRPYSAEWWHFSDTNTYPVLEALSDSAE